MLSCIKGRQCDPLAKKPELDCGSNLAYAYFVSFIFFCSFLVSFTTNLLTHYKRGRGAYVVQCCVAFHELSPGIRLQSELNTGVEDSGLLGCDAVSSGELLLAFWKSQGVPESFTLDCQGGMFFKTTGISNLSISQKISILNFCTMETSNLAHC
jgi:hypothetical protein